MLRLGDGLFLEGYMVFISAGFLGFVVLRGSKDERMIAPTVLTQ